MGYYFRGGDIVSCNRFNAALIDTRLSDTEINKNTSSSKNSSNKEKPIPITIFGHIECTVVSCHKLGGLIGWIDCLYVIPELRGYGFAKKILNESIKHFKSFKVEFIGVLCNIQNKNAIKFFKSSNFKYLKT